MAEASGNRILPMDHHDGNNGTQLQGKSKYVRKRGKGLKFTKKSSRYSWITRRIHVKKGELSHHYHPCTCESACGKGCLCLLNRTHCEKYCGCPMICKNRFRGCGCAKRQCRTRQCSCVAANRECDPDVCHNCFISCGDGTFGAPPQKEKSYNCMNMKLLQKQHLKVLIGDSGVAGWGAFLKNACEKDECIGEYRGEVITHDEADERGKTYDLMNSSYLFNLNDKRVLDANWMGNKLRYINHSSSPNCYGKILLVAGNHMIGIFASKRISAGEELFLDYCYDKDVTPSWAKDHEVSDSHKDEDYTPSSSRAKKKVLDAPSRNQPKRKASGSKKEVTPSWVKDHEVSDSHKDEEYTPSSSRAKKKVSDAPSRIQPKRKVSGSKKEATPSWAKDQEVSDSDKDEDSDSDKDEDYAPSSSRAKKKVSYTRSRNRAKGKASDTLSRGQAKRKTSGSKH